MKKVMLKTTLSLAVAMASSQLFASGFALNEQSVSGMGTGFAGRSSSADDASTVAGNPAGMSRLKRDQITAGVAAIDAKTDIKKTSGGAPGGTSDGDMVPFTAVPMMFAVKKVDDKLAFGLGVYAPFGLITDYESGFGGRYYGKKSEVKVVTFQPTVSYAFNDYVSVGFGPTFNRISGNLTSATPVAATFGRNDGKVDIKGDDTAWGYKLGILVTPTDKTNIGITYTSKVKYKLDGHTDISGIGFGPFNGGRFDASLDITTPESVDFSITQKLDDQWTVYAGSTWTRWSRLKEITVNNEGVPAQLGGSAGPIGTISEPQNWHDTWASAIGASFQVNKQWVLRTGFTVDQSPTNNTDRSVRIPTGDRKIVSFGAGFNATEDLTIDAALSYLWEEKVDVNRTGKGTPYNAEYKNSAWGYALGATYKF
ncbi:outer membrane protein transport protein [Pseudomonas sp. MAFF 311095]|uniref:Outer membrane protein transport protein n=1 Tax=Pseudomonas petroselini TaxID=2899822 RepID=A0ABS8QWH1_9PSED|nr:outer membrane protein transport protein [Pseudomonas petroselini]MCD7039529.1 outer membrane protein transport protein [Pseudomonas petroselini]MCD7047506.1 outer membrane protein transport protein [Pseudomonas petroselini]MCD7071033.1 outer membrane protein transport protein [Pseudomonas petroselini]MCD7082799.1 outer membrane protein transport protein [Pseudomonas petroselini]